MQKCEQLIEISSLFIFGPECFMAISIKQLYYESGDYQINEKSVE